jgi:Protein of unknown function (DUF2793)
MAMLENSLMDDSANLKLPYIMAAQAQKHVTHNEAIRALDALVQIAIIDRDLTVAPGSPSDGDRYIVAIGASGNWAGQDGNIAAFQDNAWMYYSPVAGWLAYIIDEALLYVHDGTNWSAYSGSGLGGSSTILNDNANGAQTRFELIEEELTLSGASVDSTVQIPDRAIVFAVSTRTTQAITGATSYDCGLSGETSKYGGALAIALDSTNSGVTGPTAFYADTSIRLTANGSNFTGGKVRLALHYMLCTSPTN